MNLFLCIVLCAVVSTCCGHRLPKPWDYLVFTQEWPGTFCQYSDCNFSTSAVTGWNIHGLWPSNSKGKDPFNCSPAPPFNIDNLQSIYKQLQSQWADLKSFDSPAQFWKHEWTKHGTCAMEDPLMPNELGYFAAGLRLKLNTGIDQSLQSAGIVPSNSNQYNEQMVSGAIRKTLQITPILRCIDYQGQLYLSAVEICTDKSLNLRNCVKSVKSNIDLAREFLGQVAANTHLSLTGRYPSTPVNAPCQDRLFILPPITQSQIRMK